MQGVGDLRFPVNFRLSPATLLSFLGSITPDLVALYTVTGLELFISVLLLGTTLGLGGGGARIAAWASVLLVQPFFNPSRFYPIAGLIPWIVEHLAWQSLLICCLVQGYKHRRQARIGWIAAALLIQGFLVAFVPFSIILSVPLVLLTLGALAWLDHRESLSSRFARAAVVFLLVGGLSMGPYIVGLLIYSVPPFFTSELVYARPNLQFISLLFFWSLGEGAMNTVIPLMALIGAGLATRSNIPILRAFSWVLIAGQLGLVAFGLIVTYVVRYRGPSMLYFEWFFWPLMFVFAGYAFVELARVLATLRFPGLPLFGIGLSIRPATLQQGILGVPLAVAIVALVFVYRSPKLTGYELPYPPGLPAIPAKLKEAIAVSKDGRWRGTAATFVSNRAATEGVDWGALVSNDIQLVRSTGNDHRTFGLWAHRVPTLFQYNQYMSPFYYALVTRAFAKPSDPQQRSVVAMTVPRVALLRMLGVSHVIMDAPLDASGISELVRERLPYIDTRTGRDYELILYRLNASNLNGFAPGRAYIVGSASEALTYLLDPGFDPRDSVVVDSPLSQPLQSPERWTIRISVSGIHVQAVSSGPALLVLPVQFSHCLRAKSSEPAGSVMRTPRLRRVDLILTGIEIEGRIDIDLRYEMSPWLAETCRIRDYLDGKSLRLGDLARAPAPVPGPGP